MIDNLFKNMARYEPNPGLLGVVSVEIFHSQGYVFFCVDVIVVTGDWVAHLQLSEKTTLEAIAKTAEIVLKYYPSTPVIASIGVSCHFVSFLGLRRCFKIATTRLCAEQ